MWRASLKNLLARKLRLMLSAMAILLGVGFVSGSFIFTDALGRVFDGISSGSVGQVVIRPANRAAPQTSSTTQDTRTVPTSVLQQVRKVPGVARVDGNVVSLSTYVVGKDGHVVGGQGAPGVALNVTNAPNATGIPGDKVVDGRMPTKAGEVALDEKTVERSGYYIGEKVTIASSTQARPLTPTLVGTVSFGSGTAGATMTYFDTATAQRLFLRGKDVFSDAWVSAPQLSQEQLRTQVAAALPKGFEAVTGDKAAKETADQFREALSFVTTFLLVFAGISLFVGAFLIVNTFSILVAQRSRELALFRALGASGRQVTLSVVLEALAIALIGSTLGLGLGVLLALAISAAMSLMGLELTSAGLSVAPRTVLIAYGVGVVVTVIAAYLPARRAGSIPPIAALRDDAVGTDAPLRRRLAMGMVLTLLGAAVLLIGLFRSVPNTMWWVGGGIFGVILGAALISPVLGYPVVRLVGLAYRRVFGAVGQMAENNALRSPRRTAATASALMIGLTLVSMMSVFGESAKASVDQVVSKSFLADFAVSSASAQPFATELTEKLKKVSGVQLVSAVRYIRGDVNGKQEFVSAIDPATFAQVAPLKLVAGSQQTLSRGGVLLDDSRAKAKDVGNRVTLKLAGGSRDTTIAGIYEKTPTPRGYLISLDTANSLGVQELDNMDFVVLQPGADRTRVQADLTKVIKAQPLLSVRDQADYADQAREPIDQVLRMIYALLGLSIVIAVVGIVNTLSLSVIERVREIGLLRAVGLTRAQLRRMIRLEAVVIALLGATLGVVLGTLFGIALQRSLADQGITALSIPWASLAIFLGAAAFVGVVAALWPAFRASRMNVLEAISTE